MLHKFVYLDGIVIFVVSVDGEADGTDESFVFTVRIDADKGRVLSMRVAVVRFDEVSEALRELLHVCFYRHK